MKRILVMFLQCTWGIVQTLMGAVVCLKLRKCHHKIYRGCIDTRWDKRGGMSLGLFIFTPNEETERAQLVRVHEYGHCIQSIVLGPLYLIPALISVIWANLPYFRNLRKEKNIPYTSCFVESWASKWGEWVTKEKAIWN